MSLHSDLLEQARHLLARERRRPRQASLRRAASAAYYALFHLLIHEATTLLVSPRAQRGRFARAFDHGDMKQASKVFGNSRQQQPTSLTGGVPVPPALAQVALAFVELQEARHEADYNVDRSFTRLEVRNLVVKAQQAFQDWQAIRDDPVARTYLASLLLWRKWNR
jgi:uncharacterized protein (UPF0332 family)